MGCFDIFFASVMMGLYISSIVLAFYNAARINECVDYGCHKSEPHLCPDWNKQLVTFSEYVDTTVDVEENCNCNTCINSNKCNCHALKCKLLGAYDNKKCTIVNNYKLADMFNSDDTVLYKTKWDFYFLNETFRLGDEKKYYTDSNKLDGLCVEISEVEKVGDYVYFLYVEVIVFGSFFLLTSLCLCLVPAWFQH